MRIISAHRDYYDWVAGFGVDPSLTFMRAPQSQPRMHDAVPPFIRTRGVTLFPRPGGRHVSQIHVGIYPNLYVRWCAHEPVADGQVRFRYYDGLSALAAEHGEDAHHVRHHFRYHETREVGRLDDARWRQVGVPLFVLSAVGYDGKRFAPDPPDEEGLYTTDPILQDFGFTEIDATDVFQRIQTFLRLDPPEPAPFDDDQKRQARGFDRRSFRKRKS